VQIHWCCNMSCRQLCDDLVSSSLIRQVRADIWHGGATDGPPRRRRGRRGSRHPVGLGRGGSGLRAARAVGTVRCSPGGGGADGGGSVLPPGRQPRCCGRLVLRPLDGETDFLGSLLVLPSDVHACEVHGRGALGGRMQLRRDASTCIFRQPLAAWTAILGFRGFKCAAPT